MISPLQYPRRGVILHDAFIALRTACASHRSEGFSIHGTSGGSLCLQRERDLLTTVFTVGEALVRR